MAMTLAPDGRLMNVRISGKVLSGDLRDVAEKVTLSISRTAVTEMSFDFSDKQDGEAFRGGGLTQGATVGYGPFLMTVEDVDYKPGPLGPTLSVKAPSSFVTKLRRQTGGYSWGGREVEEFVRAVAAGVGMGAIVQPGLGHQNMIRKAAEGDEEPESTWDVLVQLSKTTGAWIFEYGAILVFGRPSWLASGSWRNREWPLVYNGWGDYSEALEGMPSYGNHASADPRESLEFGLIGVDADTARPGDLVTMAGASAGPMAGKWLIESVDFPLTVAAPVKVKAVRPIDPKVEPVRALPDKLPSGAIGGKNVAGVGLQPNDGGAVDRWVGQVEGKAIDYDGAYGAQCVDLVFHYSRYVIGGPRLTGNGRDIFPNAAGNSSYTRLGPGDRARKGDVACWGPSWGGGWGHAAIVLSDNGGDLTCLSQNPGPARRMNLGKNGLMGYLRPVSFP